MAVDSAWDVKIVDASTLATVAYVPTYIAVQLSDKINDVGGGTLEVDFDDPFLETFYAANGSKYPWEGNYAVQVLRNGSPVGTFLIEQSDIQYSGLRRIVSLAGRSLAACLEWAVVLPEGWDEGEADPDEDIVSYARGFGKLNDTQAELDAETYTIDDPKHKAYGAAAFTFIFDEADTGVDQTWTNFTEGTADRHGDAVDWPLSLSSGLGTTNDSNGTSWATAASYPINEVNYLFEIPSGITMLDAINQLTAITSNAQWYVNPSGVIYIAKILGTDRSGSVFLTVPNAVSSSRQFRRPDLRTFMFGSNGFNLKKQSDSTQEAVFGRREGFIGHDNPEGLSNTESVQQALDQVKEPLDEFTFQYIETDTTRAWIDFVPGDTVRIEYEPGVTQDRQIVALAAAITSAEVRTEIVIGDVIDGAISRIQKRERTGQYSDQVVLKDFKAGRTPPPPHSVVATEKEGGPFNSGVNLTWVEPIGWENSVSHYEIDVTPTGKRSDGTTNYTGKNASGGSVTYDNEPIKLKAAGASLLVNGLGRPDGEYKAKIRTVSMDQRTSDYTTEKTFSLSSFNTTVVSGHIASADYNPGTAGWVIKANGDVEFDSGEFRGAITAGTIDIGGSDSSSFHVDAAGQMWSGAASYASAPFKVSSGGNVTANTISLGSAGTNSTMIMGGSGNVKLRVSSTEVVTSTTSLEWLNSSLGTLHGHVYAGSAGTFDGISMNNGSNNNYIQVLNTHGDNHGIHLVASKTSANNIDVFATGTITLHGTNGIEIPSHTPTSTTNKLYNVGGTLYFNGAAAGGGSGTITEITTSGLGLSGGGTSGSVNINLILNELTTSTTNGNGDYFAVVDSAGAQYKLTKGDINLSEFNNNSGWTSNTGTITEITTSPGLDGGGTSGSVNISLDLNELATSFNNGNGDYFAVVDSVGTQHKLRKSDINLSEFNNNSGWTSNTGDITGVTAGDHLTGGGTTGTVTLNVNAVTASTVSTVVARNSVGDINVRLLRSEYDSTNATIGYIMTQVDTASNNYVRPSTPAQFRAAVTDSHYVKSIHAGSGIAVNAMASDGSVDVYTALGDLGTSWTDSDGAYFIVATTNGAANRKLVKGNINLSGFNNNLGWTSNTGDITSVTAGTNMTGGGSSGAVTLSVATGAFVEASSGTYQILNGHKPSSNATVSSGATGLRWSSVYASALRETTLIDTLTGNSLNLRTSSLNRLTINSTGNVGIGTATPSYKLEVNGTVYVSNDFSVKDSAGSGTSLFVDKSLNRVGINESSPGTTLDVGGAIWSTGSIITSGGDVAMTGSGSFVSWGPQSGSGTNCHWASYNGIRYLVLYSSVRNDKENITSDLQEWMTPQMVDSLSPKMFNRKKAPGLPEIGFIAEEAEAVSQFIVSNGTDENGDKLLEGLNEVGLIALLVVSLKDARNRIAALEAA